MAFYLIILIVTYIILMLSKSNKSNSNKVYKIGFVTISILLLSIIAGIRYNVGTDFRMYDEFFYNANKLPLFSENLEFMFVLSCKVFKALFNDSFFLFFFTALFSYYFVYKNALITNKYYELTIYMFFAFGFFTNTFNVLRQWMAIPTLYLGMNYILNNKKKNGIMLIILSVLCHYTAIIPALMFLVISRIKSDKTRILIIVGAIFLYLNLDLLMSFLYKILLFTGYGAKYYKYFTRESYNNLNASIFSYPMLSLLCYLAYLIFIPVCEKKNMSNVEHFLISCIVIGFFTALIGTKNNLFERMQLYFIFPMIYVIPMIVEKSRTSNKKIIYACCIILGTLLYVYGLNHNGGEVVPYQTIFNKYEAKSSRGDLA